MVCLTSHGSFLESCLEPCFFPPGLQSTIRQSMEESLIQILSPKRRIDILRDVMVAKEKGAPYVITFCGVNGVGKSTNLAKVCVCVCCSL